MPLVEFVGQTAQESGNKQTNTARLVNCFRVPVTGQGKTRFVLKQAPVFEQVATGFADPLAKVGRGANGQIYVVDGAFSNNLKQINTTTYAKTNIGTITTDGNAQIASNFDNTTINSGTAYYIWDGSTLTTNPAGLTFSGGVETHFYAAGYTIVTEQAGPRFQWSALGDAKTWNALHFNSMEAQDDSPVRGFELRGQMVLCGARTMELWATTGAAGANAWRRVTSWSKGIKNRNLVVKADDNLFWVGDDGNCYYGLGTDAIDITIPAVREALADGANNDALMTYLEFRGHKFCLIQLNTGLSYVFDATMGEWAEWYPEVNTDGSVSIFDAVKADTGEWLAGYSFGAGRLCAMRKVGDYTGVSPEMCIVSSPIYLGDVKHTIKEFEAVITSENDTTVALQVSRDGGSIFTASKTRDIGPNAKRTVWRMLGQAQEASFKLIIDDNGEVEINTTCVLQIVPALQ